MAKKAEQTKAYTEAVERAVLEAKAIGKTAKAASVAVIRDLSQNLVTVGSIVQIPDFGESHQYQIFPAAIGGEFFIAAGGEKVWLSSLTRGAKDPETGEYVCPSGSAVESAQNFTNWQKFLSTNRGKWLHYVSNTTLSVLFKGKTEPVDVRVWHIELLDEKPTE